MTGSRVLVVGDSLSIPRSGCAYEDTWVYKLKWAHPSWDVISQCEGGSSTNVLLLERAATGANCLSLYRPDMIVLQLGIVDCAPRLFRQGSLIQKILRRIPARLSDYAIEWIKKHKGRRPEYAIVQPKQFRSNLDYYFQCCAEAGVGCVVVIAIAYPDARMISKNPGVVASIQLYNQIYRELSKKYPFVCVVEPLNEAISNSGLYGEDGYHLNEKAHEIIWRSIDPVMRVEKQ